MAVRNVELVHEYFPNPLRMGTTRINNKNKSDIETEEEGKRRVNMERSAAGRKKRCTDSLAVARAYRLRGVATSRGSG